jgi:hypothetical protein
MGRPFLGKPFNQCLLFLSHEPPTAPLPHYRIATLPHLAVFFALRNAKKPYLCLPFTKTMGYGDSWYRFGPASPGSIFKREKSKT